MSLEITGKLEKFLTVEKGTSQAGKEWQKQQFIVTTEEEYNNTYCFEVFGDEKVENLTKFQKAGDQVKVIFNVNTNEWKGKYYTSLSAWRIEKEESDQSVSQPSQTEQVEDDLPF